MRLLRAICRIVFGILFVLSGFLKAIDPIGSALKIKEYLDAFHLSAIDFISAHYDYTSACLEVQVLISLGEN